MDIILSLITLFGGLGIFLYGTNLTSEGLQKETATKMQQSLKKITANKYHAVLTGIVLTVFLQSSSATTVLLVSFVSASILTLSQALGIILGAAIGTTFTVQLIAFKITDYALFFVGIGACLKLFGNSERWKNIGLAILGFGFLFYGMALMSMAVLPLRNYPFFIDLLILLSEQPLLMLLVATIFTSIVQSSAATIALAMSLALQGAIPGEATIPIVFGANIGTTTTALISSLSSTREAKKVAIAHLIFKVVGVIIFLPFLNAFYNLNVMLTSDIPRQIANAHTIFNIVNTITFLPFTTQFAKLMDKIMPSVTEKKVVKHLDERVLDVPDLALTLAKNEVLHMGELVRKQIDNIPSALINKCIGTCNHMSAVEKDISILYKEISKYLTVTSQRNLTEEQSIESIRLLYTANDLEHLADIALSMGNLTYKMLKLDVDFHKDDWNELEQLQDLLENNFNKTIDAFKNMDIKSASEVIKSHPLALRLEKKLRLNHFQRMNNPSDKDVDASSVHMDLINSYVNMHNHLVTICQAIMGNI